MKCALRSHAVCVKGEYIESIKKAQERLILPIDAGDDYVVLEGLGGISQA